MADISSIIYDLSDVIRKLEDAEFRLGNNFEGIGTEKIRDAVSERLQKCHEAQNRLNCIDMSKVDE